MSFIFASPAPKKLKNLKKVLRYSGNTENSIGNGCQYQYNIAILTTMLSREIKAC